MVEFQDYPPLVTLTVRFVEPFVRVRVTEI